MKPYYADDSVTLHHGDSLDVLRTLPDQSVDSCVTSPPYFGLRDYGEEGQYGLEASPAEYVETMRALFAEVRRVLADDGTLWLNLGDTYSSGSGGGIRAIPAKNLLGLPWKVAFALQDHGWILRNAIVWAKANGMPVSVQDRFATKYEHVFLFSKSQRYWFDLDAVRVPHAEASLARYASGLNKQEHPSASGAGGRDGIPAGHVPEHGANPGDVWSINMQPFAEAHFAAMPSPLAERCVLAGCKPGGTVLDPFSGSGTTGMVAQRHGRKYVGIDLNREYLDLSLRTRLQQAALDFGEVS